jgi:hypothetical protein
VSVLLYVVLVCKSLVSVQVIREKKERENKFEIFLRFYLTLINYLIVITISRLLQNKLCSLNPTSVTWISVEKHDFRHVTTE